MSAFGKRNGTSGGGGAQRPAFGVARPMHGPETGGAQFPPIDSVPLPGGVTEPGPERCERYGVGGNAERGCG